MKIEIFDFNRHWHLVEPHLNDPEVIELLNQGMRRFSLRDDRWAHLPIWDSENGNGPWEYSKSDSHGQYASEHYFEDPDYEILREKYYNLVENMGVNLDENDLDIEEFLYDSKTPEFEALQKKFIEELNEIEKKYYPKKNTYQWYQCFGAADHLSEWSKKLAEKVYPYYSWEIYRKYKKKKINGRKIKQNTGCTTTIGKNKIGDFIIFDIMLFEECSVDEILDAVGLDRIKLQKQS